MKGNQRNLKCEFEQFVEEGKKWLQIVFVVNFDFLPEFREEVRLEYVELKESLKEINFTNMKAEVEEISRTLDSMEKIGTTNHFELAPLSAYNR